MRVAERLCLGRSAGIVPISRPTAHRRFTGWVQAGVMRALHEATLDVLGAAGQIDWSRASVDAMHVRTGKGLPAWLSLTILS